MERMAARHRLGKFLLRRGLVYPGSNWTIWFWRWLDGVEWEQAEDVATVAEHRWAVEQREERLKAVDDELERHLAVELGVFGEVNLAHAAGTEAFHNPIMGQGGTDH
jgi:hypothetical protein